MRVTTRAKRRWYTKYRQARIVFNTRFGRLADNIGHAMSSKDMGTALAAALKEQLIDICIRPLVREVVKGLQA